MTNDPTTKSPTLIVLHIRADLLDDADVFVPHHLVIGRFDTSVGPQAAPPAPPPPPLIPFSPLLLLSLHHPPSPPLPPLPRHPLPPPHPPPLLISRISQETFGLLESI